MEYFLLLVPVILVILMILLAIAYYYFLLFFTRRPPNDPNLGPEINKRLSHRFGAYLDYIRESSTRFHSLDPEAWEIKSADGLKLKAWYLPLNQSRRTAICCHGWQAGHSERLPSALKYRELGFNVLVLEQRSQGVSEGRFITMGHQEACDLIAWGNEVIRRVGTDSELLFDGASMGGATVLTASGHSDIQTAVKAIISDCAYTSVLDMTKLFIPTKVRFLSPLVMPFVDLWARMLAGFGFRKGSPLEAVSRSHTPTFFVHGEGDHFVPVEMCHRLYKACTASKSCFTVPAAGHTEAAFTAGSEYWTRIETFIKPYFKTMQELTEETR